VAHVLAVWFGCGYFPRAPGTCGKAAALRFIGAVFRRK